MHARVVLGVGKGVLFREVSSVQECPHREREVPLYIYTPTTYTCTYYILYIPALFVYGREIC